jgi:hypothetical protein
LILGSGQIFLALIAARVALWVLRGWRDYPRGPADPRGPRGPGGGLRILAGGSPRRARGLAPPPRREAA